MGLDADAVCLTVPKHERPEIKLLIKDQLTLLFCLRLRAFASRCSDRLSTRSLVATALRPPHQLSTLMDSERANVGPGLV